MTSLVHGSPCSSTWDLYDKEQSQEKAERAGKRHKEEGTGCLRKPSQAAALSRLHPLRKPAPGVVLWLLWLTATLGGAALHLQESCGDGTVGGGAEARGRWQPDFSG